MKQNFLEGRMNVARSSCDVELDGGERTPELLCSASWHRNYLYPNNVDEKSFDRDLFLYVTSV